MKAFDGTSGSALRALASAFRSGQLGPTPTKFSIAKVAKCSETAVSELIRLSHDGMAPAHLALLLDALAGGAEARMGGAASCELVWTGPEGTVSQSRDTLVVLDELFARAERSVLVSTFAIYQGPVVFKTLAGRMELCPELRVRLFVHVARDWRDSRDESEVLREFAHVLAQEWPWPKRPEVYYAPRTLSLDPAQRAAWHAKCVLVDDDVAFVTSANFTEWAHQRNIEAGVLVHGGHFVSQLRAQFDALMNSKQVRRLPGF